MNITAQGLEEYLSDSNPSKQISLKEAIELKALPLSREFTYGVSDIRYADGDIYSFYGNCAVDIENVFSDLFLEHRIVGFVPYKVTQIETTFGIKFKVDTMVVIASEREWRTI
jgi:hypothetical protein